MSRAAANKLYNNFSAGFITEATELGYPENSVKDIDNCDIDPKGYARRRLGLDEEVGGQFTAYGYIRDNAGTNIRADEMAITSYVWNNPGNVQDLSFLVTQYGRYLFFNVISQNPVSSQTNITNVMPQANSVDLRPYKYSPHGGIQYKPYIVGGAPEKDYYATDRVSFASGFGRLWVTGRHIRPLVITYYPEIGPLSQVVATTKFLRNSLNGPFLPIRDFTGLDDNLKSDDNPSTLSDKHLYNLINQGWDKGKIDDYYNEANTNNTYPSNGQQWILGKNSSNDFNVDELLKQQFGNATAPKGHCIYDALYGVKEAYDPKTDDQLYPPDPTLIVYDNQSSSSFSSIAFFSGRLWLSGERSPSRPNGVYFSKTIQKVEDAAQFCSDNDPTSENFSDVLATDGGVIYITEADTIKALLPYGSGILVFATNGIWFIQGGSGAFAADDYNVNKISNIGILSKGSIVRTESAVLFFGESSIYGVSLPQQGTIPIVNDISEKRILTYYNQINKSARQQATGVYDLTSKKVYWLYREAETYNFPENQWINNKILILDTKTAAFTKYSIVGVDYPTAFGVATLVPKGVVSLPSARDAVVLSDGTQVDLSDLSTEVVVKNVVGSGDDYLSSIIAITSSKQTSATIICEFSDTSFFDFNSFNPIDYTSYLVTAPETLGDVQRDKQATYVYSFLRKTEEGYISNSDLTVSYAHPSGVLVSGQWDWQVSDAGGRWSKPQQGYRFKKAYVPVDVDSKVDNGEGLCYTKLKVRGHGRALSLRYESELGKDFQLAGYSVPYTATEREQ